MVCVFLCLFICFFLFTYALLLYFYALLLFTCVLLLYTYALLLFTCVLFLYTYALLISLCVLFLSLLGLLPTRKCLPKSVHALVFFHRLHKQSQSGNSQCLHCCRRCLVYPTQNTRCGNAER